MNAYKKQVNIKFLKIYKYKYKKKFVHANIFLCKIGEKLCKQDAQQEN